LAQLFARAVKQFFDWTHNWRLKLQEIEALTVAAYIEQPGATVWKPTRDAVRGPRYVVRHGKTPVLSAEEARKLPDSIESNTLIGLRDRALIGTTIAVRELPISFCGTGTARPAGKRRCAAGASRPTD
jgi:integrase/recombinase XerD